MTTEAIPRNIGVVARELEGDFWLRLVAGAVEVLQGQGATPLCFSQGTLPSASATPFLSLVNAECVSGVVVLAASFQAPDAMPIGAPPSECSAPLSSRGPIEQFLRGLGGLPAVCVSSWLPGVPSLWIQNAAGIRLLMRHLADTCGRRRIALIRGPETNLEAEARYRAWEDFCIEHSLPHDEELIECGDFTAMNGELAALRLLERCCEELPDAILACNDAMAIGVLRALRQKKIAVPNDISVVGFDDLEAVSAEPALTTVRQPVFEMGQRAAEILLAMLRKEPVQEETMFTPELVVRASCLPRSGAAPHPEPPSRRSAGLFLARAHPMAASSSESGPQESAALMQSPTVVLDECVRYAQAREHDLVECIRQMRANAIFHLGRELAGITTLTDLHRVLEERMCCLNLNSLVAALVPPSAVSVDQSEANAKLVIDCSTQQDASLAPLGSRLPGARIIAAQARRASFGMQVVHPLHCGRDYRGFLVASGRLIDNKMLRQLGALLLPVLERIGGQ